MARARDGQVDDARLRGDERWLMPRPEPATYTAAVCYPSPYHVGMSNLGLHRLLELIAAEPGWCPLRVFLPQARALGRARLRTFDRDVALTAVDVLAFTVSYEEDYPHVWQMLAGAGLAPRAVDRAADDPLVVIGGFAPTLNPEPLAPLADVVVLGAAEIALSPLLRRWATLLARYGRRQIGRDALGDALSGLPGVYVPGEAPPQQPVRVAAAAPRWDGAAADGRALQVDLAAADPPPRTRVLTPHTEFADRYLVAVGDGCPQGCRFCAASFGRRPPRAVDGDVLRRAVDEGLRHTRRIGLLGAAVSDLPSLPALARQVAAAGGDLSTSSLRIGALGGPGASGSGASEPPALGRTVTVAPEAGSARLRAAINKPLDDDTILDVLGACARGGAARVRAYLLVGLPGEQDEDLDALIALARRGRERLVEAGRASGRVPELLLSINPFVPKPDTPLQWAPLADTATLRRRLARVRAGLRGTGGVVVQTGGARVALRQAVLSLGDRDVHELLADGDRGWWARLRRWHDAHGGFAHLEKPRDHPFPWAFVDRGVDRAFLWREWTRARAGKPTPRCDVIRCRACGACVDV